MSSMPESEHPLSVDSVSAAAATLEESNRHQLLYACMKVFNNRQEVI